MKTAKYTIQFLSIDTPMSMEITISKTEYERQIAALEKWITQTADNEYPLEKRVQAQENEQLEIVRTYYTVGCGDTLLTEYKCKPGYCFKK